MAKWITFEEVPSNKKTKTFNITAKEGSDHLGVVKWFASWRKYAFFPAPNTLYEPECLSDIAEFLKGLMQERKESKVPSLTEMILSKV
jgi:hypothetical protein